MTSLKPEVSAKPQKEIGTEKTLVKAADGLITKPEVRGRGAWNWCLPRAVDWQGCRCCLILAALYILYNGDCYSDVIMILPGYYLNDN
jgi:hypothetical protein